MNQPNECKWCGHELVDETTNDELFACGSSHRFSSDTWSQSKGCMEIMQSRERIQRALEAIKTLERYTVSTRGYFLQTIMRSDVIRILEGGDNEQAD